MKRYVSENSAYTKRAAERLADRLKTQYGKSMSMDTLRAKLQLIIGEKTHKLKELEATSPESIDCPILECEINDAVYMIVILNSNESDEGKLAGIRAINNQTTSNSIYDTVNAYLESK